MLSFIFSINRLNICQMNGRGGKSTFLARKADDTILWIPTCSASNSLNSHRSSHYMDLLDVLILISVNKIFCIFPQYIL